MTDGSEDFPKVLEMPTSRTFVPVTDEQVAALLAAQARVDEASALRDALLMGILTGAHLVSGRVLRVTDEHPRRLEVEISSNGNGA
jgi:hypothetical protein